jgi:hypothetical protein
MLQVRTLLHVAIPTYPKVSIAMRCLAQLVKGSVVEHSAGAKAPGFRRHFIFRPEIVHRNLI